jgi:hypothetical protein
MSLSTIVFLAAVVSALIGIKIYLELKKSFNSKKEDEKLKEKKSTSGLEDLNAPTANHANNDIALVEQKEDLQLVQHAKEYWAEDLTYADLNLAAEKIEIETPKKQKPKKRYYSKPGKKAVKKTFTRKKKSE